mgnify:CR=1 FL=1
MINVAILGYGTVGSGVFEVLNENKESIFQTCRTGTSCKICSGSS